MLGKQANGTQEKTCQFEIKKISCEVSEHIKALGCFTKQKELRKNKISSVSRQRCHYKMDRQQISYMVSLMTRSDCLGQQFQSILKPRFRDHQNTDFFQANAECK